jgi:hypothetical protein
MDIKFVLSSVEVVQMSKGKKEVGTKLAAWMESPVMCPPECCHSISRRVFIYLFIFSFTFLHVLPTYAPK